jgi:hypothetical protein
VRARGRLGSEAPARAHERYAAKGSPAWRWLRDAFGDIALVPKQPDVHHSAVSLRVIARATTEMPCTTIETPQARQSGKSRLGGWSRASCRQGQMAPHLAPQLEPHLQPWSGLGLGRFHGKPRLSEGFSHSGGGIRTRDLRVMSFRATSR